MREILERRIDQAMGRMAADLVVRNARILDLATGVFHSGDIAICGEMIVGTGDSYRGVREIDAGGRIAVPGFIDSHVHCESTLVVPSEFDRCVLTHGTTTAICDPHEICNVLGMAGLRYFLDSALGTAMDLRVQLSSCVPATPLETSGARLGAADLVAYRDHPKVIGLAEFMNVPGVLNKDPDCLDKLAAFQGAHIDGHAPLLSGRSLNAYLACGVRNCHETTSLEEGREKLSKGMQVLIREGTASQDLAALVPLIDEFTSPFLGFCTDDRNPLDIHEEGHIDHLVRRAIAARCARGRGLSHCELVGGPRFWTARSRPRGARLSRRHPAARRSCILRGASGAATWSTGYGADVRRSCPATTAGRQFGAAGRRDSTDLRGSCARPIHAGDRHHSGEDPYRASAS